MVRLPLEKTGGWMVIVTTDSKGRVRAFPHEGRDHDTAFQWIEQRHADANGLWMVHWEKGFASRADAEKRAREIERDVGAGKKPGTVPVN